jgi:hypothetical protein
MKEEALQLGEGGRLFAILCEPQERLTRRPVFVFLSAGLLHRVGPSRLHVTLARDLAEMGFASLRVDLSGKGDSPGRGSMKNRESVALDFDDLRSSLAARYGDFSMVLAGLCSGADNAVRLAVTEPGVTGLLLLDPICFPDAGFRRRALAAKWLNPRRYARSLKRMLRGEGRGERHGPAPDDDPLMLRDLPSREDMRRSFDLVRDRGGSVLSIFTQYALSYYNSAGQLRAVLQVSDYPAFCTELFWPDVEHTYKLEIHRERLRAHVLDWARRFD